MPFLTVNSSWKRLSRLPPKNTLMWTPPRELISRPQMSSQLLNSWGVSTTLRLGETREISETPFSRVPPPFGWLDCPGRSATTPRGAPGLPPAPAPLRALPGFRGTRKPALDSCWNPHARSEIFRLIRLACKPRIKTLLLLGVKEFHCGMGIQ